MRLLYVFQEIGTTYTCQDNIFQSFKFKGCASHRRPRMTWHLFLWGVLASGIRSHGQEEGFLSIDCGIAEDLNFTDAKTKIFYTSDAKLINAGTNKQISEDYMFQTLPKQYQNVRYPDDAYDPVWSPRGDNPWIPINTSSSINLSKDIGYQPPLPVMNTSVMLSNLSENFSFYFPRSNGDPRLQYHVFMHFAELERLQSNHSREFNFYMDGNYAYGPFSPKYLSVVTIFTTIPLSGRDQHTIDLCKTMSSTLPPNLNAVEVFTITQLSTSPTNSTDGKL
ncbi:hypothetical protein MRB53_012836 [Persea americana]|uniref:Uncharacterized protein n=1 Tax=Persea americana TaxID=3435 RepID=A0ACC2LYZ9_PERAE|nr:hypothetical protein MRB53_012836 [Persea americana]